MRVQPDRSLTVSARSPAPRPPFRPRPRTLRCSVFAPGLVLCLAAASTRAQVEYTLQAIPAPPNTLIMTPLAMNNQGHVVGVIMTNEPGGLTYSWHWSQGAGLTILPTPANNGLRNKAVDINDSGVIVGDGRDNSGFPWIYQNGQYTVLRPTPPASAIGGFAGAISNGGIFVGAFDQGIGSGNRGFILVPGQPLLSIDPTLDNQALSVNDDRLVAGTVGSRAGFTWDPASGRLDIPPLDQTWTLMGVSKINTSGLVLGTAAIQNVGNVARPYFYSRAGGVQPLQQLRARTTGYGLNDRGDAVGEARDSTGSYAWVFTADRGMRELTPLVEPALGARLITAFDIDNTGRIIAQAFIGAGTFRYAVLLTPVGLPAPCYANCDGSTAAPVLNVNDFVCFQSRFAAADRAADCNADTALNVNDFICFQSRFAAGCP